MKTVVEALLITLGLLVLGVRFVFFGLFTAVVPAVGLVVAAVVSGAVRTAVLCAVFPLVALAYLTIAVADAAGQVVPAPRRPRPLGVA
ncbi:hypothetical protein AB0I53_11945 [Saccharopolyspora sp. NPDC050389]|uniref:hypothetical protein n=1 Tax=Saccharopolyspora sp. NPDC050389 TaxID=3155516 RepID=UPI0034097544